MSGLALDLLLQAIVRVFGVGRHLAGEVDGLARLETQRAAADAATAAGGFTYRAKIKEYMRRHKVKPGITGWAQVCGWRGQTDTEEKFLRRLEHDLYYIENWSVLFDLHIMAMTPILKLRTFAGRPERKAGTTDP